MKRIILITVLLVCCSVQAVAQDSDHPVTDLGVDRLRVRLSMCGSLVGLGSTASLVGESVVWHTSDASALSWNPAALGFLDRRSMVTDWVPGLLQDVNKFYNINSAIEEEMDAVISDHGTEESMVTYPAVSAKAGLQGSVAGFGLAVPFRIGDRKLGLGFGYSTPLLLDLQVQGTGIEAGIDSEQDIQGELRRIRMRTQLNLEATLQARMSQYQFGLGCELGQGAAVGLSVSRFHIRARADAYAGVEGIIEMSGSEYAFNDPYDPHIDFEAGEQNDLYQSLYADFSGSGWGIKLGAVKQITTRLRVGLTVSLPPKLEITGVDSSVNNRIPFIQTEEDDGGESIDDLIDPTKIDLAKLTKTERIVKKNYFSPEIRLPQTYNLGLIWGGSKLSLIFRYTKYSGTFSLGLLKEEIRGLKLNHGVGLGLDLRYAFLGVSANFADEILPDGDMGQPLIVPKLNLGARVPAFAGTWIDGLLGVVPTPLVRFTVRHSF